MIESAKITFSRIGIHNISGNITGNTNINNGIIYLPRVAIKIQGRKSARVGYLPAKDKIDRFGKKDYLGVCVLLDFIVIVTTNEYIIVDEDVKVRASLKPSDVGRIVGVQKEGFTCNNGNRLQLHDITGKVIAERFLTEEETKALRS